MADVLTDVLAIGKRRGGRGDDLSRSISVHVYFSSSTSSSRRVPGRLMLREALLASCARLRQH